MNENTWAVTAETLPAPVQIAGACCGPFSGSGYNWDEMAKRLTEELGLKSDYLDLFHFLAIVTDCEGRIIFAAGSEYGNCGLWVKAAFEVFYQDGARFNPGYVGHEETVFD